MNSCHSPMVESEKKEEKKRQLCKTYNYQKWTKTNIYSHPIPPTIQWIFYEVKKNVVCYMKKINDEHGNRKEKRAIISSNKK